MNRMNKILAMLFGLQLVILIATRLGSSGEVQVKPQKLLGAVKSSDVTKIEIIDDQKKSAVLQREAGSSDGWVLQSGADYPVKKARVEDLLGKLTNLTAAAPVAEASTHHRALEVSAERFQRKMTLSFKEGKPRTYYLGSSPAIKQVHFRRDGEKKVYAASELSTWDIATSAATWVETSYFKVEKEHVVELSLQNAEGEIKLTKADGGWRLAGLKAGQKLDASSVDSFLGSVTSIALQEPVSKAVGATGGLAEAVATLTVVTEKAAEPKGEPKASEDGDANGKAAGGVAQPPKAGDSGTQIAAKADVKSAEGEGAPKVRKTYRLRVGKKQGEDYLAKSDGSSFVVTIGSWAAEPLLKKKVADFVEKPSAAKAKSPTGMPGPPGMPGGFGHPGHTGG